ncbi:MAG TPA: PEP/pyruvate-binding domain-containing protein, partial [Myxococcaceae bacterium]|nr:PEP/pyruvate-binding domain-containing protein [Myxococcaceae bacterium]
MSGPFTVRFDEPGAGEPSLVGGKGANLARLAAAGLPVPEGFCVTTAAFHALLDDPSLQQALQSLEGLTPEDEEALCRAAADLRARIESRPLPEEARRAIEEALAACGLEHAYAVRSSATAEDLPEASFAGQQDTYLNVRGTESLLEKVRACMASLFTERATLYRARQGIPHSRVANAVVVQRMVRPDASGILFTADPLTGHRGVSTIDAGFGLGEALVSGKVTADLVRVDESSGRVLEYKPGDKRIAIHPLPGGGSETVELPPEQRSARVLSEAEARTLMELGKEVEALQGSPQDVEWCREAGRFYVLQARPITSLFPLPSPAPRDGALHVYWSLSHKQSMPEAMPPLVLDLWRRLMPLGKPRGSPRLNPWSATAGGRLYADRNPFLAHPRRRRRLLQSGKATDELAWTALEELVHRPGLQRGQRVRLSELTPWLSLGGAPELFGLILQKPEGAAERERAWLDDYTRQATARIRAPTTLRARLQAMMEVLCESGLVLVRRAMPILLGHLAQTALERLFPEALDDVAALGRGFEEDAITRMNLALGDVADEARRHPA